MKKYLILCYSKTGNSRFMAEKLRSELACDLETAHPFVNNIGFLYLFPLLKFPVPTNISTDKIKAYEEIIVMGPIWGGLLVAPLRTLLKQCLRLSKPVHFAVTCETTENQKDDKYGYNQVLRAAMKLGGQLVKTTAAFSTSLVTGYGEKITTDINAKAKITEENFSEKLKARLDDFKNRILGI